MSKKPKGSPWLKVDTKADLDEERLKAIKQLSSKRDNSLSEKNPLDSLVSFSPEQQLRRSGIEWILMKMAIDNQLKQYGDLGIGHIGSERDPYDYSETVDEYPARSKALKEKMG